MVLWAEPCTALLISNCDCRGDGLGGGRLQMFEHITCSTLKKWVECVACSKVNFILLTSNWSGLCVQIQGSLDPHSGHLCGFVISVQPDLLRVSFAETPSSSAPQDRDTDDILVILRALNWPRQTWYLDCHTSVYSFWALWFCCPRCWFTKLLALLAWLLEVLKPGS